MREEGAASTAAGEPPLLEVHDLTKEYPARQSHHRVNSAVSGVSFNVDYGEIVGLVGESGCGKSTLARCVGGLLEPSGGSVRVLGRSFFEVGAAERRELRRDVQFVFQDPYASLNPRKKVGQIVTEPLRSYGVGRAQRDEQMRDMLHKVGLRPSDATRYPRAFSGGQRQRIAIARAVVLEPKLLIADEPVSALDVSIQAQILNLLLDLRDERQLGMLFISHDLTVVRHVADRILVMFRGSIVESGSAEEVYARPAHPYTRALLAAAPTLLVGASGSAPRQVASRAPLPEDVGDEGCSFLAACPYAQDACRRERPRLAPVGASQHAACIRPRAWEDVPDPGRHGEPANAPGGGVSMGGGAG